MSKYLLLGMTVALAAMPAQAQAQAVSLECIMTASERQAFINMGSGYAENAQQVMHLIVDQAARKVTVWETSPSFPNGNRTVYSAAFNGTVASWTIGDPSDGPQAHDSVDAGTNILTTVDPDGDATQWNCA